MNRRPPRYVKIMEPTVVQRWDAAYFFSPRYVSRQGENIARLMKQRSVQASVIIFKWLVAESNLYVIKFYCSGLQLILRGW
jgi:hypothetical protein